MELGLSASLRGEFARRAAPICCGGALAGAAVFVATHDPSAAGTRYPGCVFHQMTGLWCPGCGLTRGTHELLHGHLGAALGYNVFTPVALAVIVVAWLGWLTGRWSPTVARVPPRVKQWSAAAGLAMMITYSVLRNLPVAPFRALAP
jgi:Protein of unknown function (DUF2752)